MNEITIQNEQEKIKTDKELENLICSVINKTIEEENFKYEAIVSVTVTDNESIHKLNAEHRNIDRETDVLSFPVLEFNGGDAVIDSGDMFDGKVILGDIVLSAEKALEQSREYGHSFEREVGFLVCHSTLHLLGYDHINDDERAVMRQKEEHTLEILKLTR